MPNIAPKTVSNRFYQARCEASTHNERLSSREGAADLMCIDRGRLYRIESGVMNPYPEEVHLMADLYNAPELRNYYCTEMCPLGECIPRACVEPLQQSGIKLFTSSARISKTIERFMEIVEDGKVGEDEKNEFKDIINNLNELTRSIQSLNLWSEKHIQKDFRHPDNLHKEKGGMVRCSLFQKTDCQ